MKTLLFMLIGMVLTASTFGQVTEKEQRGESANVIPTAIAKTAAPGYALLDKPLLEAFLDGTVKTAMEDHHLPGVTISVVQNGRLILAKGYGLARTDPPQAVVADQTLFRIASISKTITFSAVMQLVEQDLLDLDADIENILDDVRIED